MPETLVVRAVYQGHPANIFCGCGTPAIYWLQSDINSRSAPYIFKEAVCDGCFATRVANYLTDGERIRT